MEPWPGQTSTGEFARQDAVHVQVSLDRPASLAVASRIAVENPICRARSVCSANRGQLVQAPQHPVGNGFLAEQFTARDIISRWDMLELGRRATAPAAAAVLDRLVPGLGGDRCVTEVLRACIRMFERETRSLVPD